MAEKRSFAPDWHIALALALLPFVLFWPLTLVRATFYVHDVQNYFYPYHAVSAAMLRVGNLPLWNPYAFSGIPLLGDGQTAMFYPPNWLFFILPGAAALNYAILLQFSIAGVSMFFCALGFGLGRLPALLAAVTFMFCGMITARVVHLSIMSGVALIPLVVLCVDRALLAVPHFQPRPRRWFVAAALAVALQAVAGHPQVPVYTAGALALLALLRGVEAWLVSERWQRFVAVGLRFLGVYILGYALAAIQLVPWVELGAASPRAAGASFDFVMGSGAHGVDWLLFIFPYLAGAQQVGAFAATPINLEQAVRTWEHSAYVGVPTLALALLGFGAFVQVTVERGWREPDKRFFATKRTKDTKKQLQTTPSHEYALSPLWKEQGGEGRRWFTLLFLVLLVVGAALVGAGRFTPIARLVYQLPVVGKLREVERVLALAAFGLPLLAGFGLQWLLDWQQAQRFRSVLALLAGAILAATCLFWIAFAGRSDPTPLLGIVPPELPRLALRYANAWVPLMLALGTAALLAVWAFRRPDRVTIGLLALLVLIDMTSYALSFNPTTAASLYSYRPQSLAALDGGGQPFRKATVLLNRNDWPNQVAQETLAVSWSMAYGIEDVNGFNSLQPRRYTDYLFGSEQTDVSYGFLANQALFQPESPILGSLNVRYLLVPTEGPQPQFGPHLRQVYANADVRVYENMLVWPRAFFSERVRGETDPQAVLRTVTAAGFDARRESLIESATPPTLPAPSGSASVQITAQGPNSLRLATQTSVIRFLVVSEMYFPGWQASIDGISVPIERTNYLFRGIVVPAGAHTVSFDYRPVSALIGLAISLIAAALALWLALRRV